MTVHTFLMRTASHAATMAAAILLCLPLAWAAPPNTSTAIEAIPPNVGLTGNNKPMMMLVSSKDHTLFGPMYTDFEDLDGDGVIDTTFKPDFKYYGYFDSTKCYTYANNRFEPNTDATVVSDRYECGGSGQWAGNFLNWATMTRLDIVRKILYGGQRQVDSASETVLQVARLSRDSHSFVKYYRGTDIRQYTPFSMADLVKTTGSNKDTTLDGAPKGYSGLTMCIQADTNDTGATSTPQIRMAKGNYRMWATVEGGTVCNWGSGALGDKLSRYYGGTQAYQGNGGVQTEKRNPVHETNPPSETTDGAKYGSIGPTINARVKVCVSDKLGDENCQAYGSGSSLVYKPVGLLQQFGTPQAGSTSARAEFGLITGSYDRNLNAGALRKNILDLMDEVNPTNGRFCHSGSSVCPSSNLTDGRSYTNAGAIKALDSIILYGKTSGNYSGSNVQLPSEMTNGTLAAWGNPVGEMVVQALQYYGALSSTNPTTTTNDASISMPVASWADPLSYTNTWRKTAYGTGICRPLSILALSSSSLSFDGNDADSAFSTLPNRSRGSLSDFTDAVGAAEGINGSVRSVGNVSNTWGEECSGKTVGSLSSVNGICPEAPAVGGTYKIAGAALYGNTNKIRTVSNPPSDLPDTALKVKTYTASLAGGVARIEVPVPNTSPQKYVYITPEGLWAANSNGKKMPAAMLTFNAISSSATHGAFMVTWNDSLFGGDYDMDIAGYLRYDIVTGGTQPQLKITTDIINTGAGWTGAHGFSVIGTNRDGRYLTHRHNSSDSIIGTTPGYLCRVNAYSNSSLNNLSTATIPANGVFPGLPAGSISYPGPSNTSTPNAACTFSTSDTPVTITFNMVGAESVTLKDPLWYAAKYGSFNPTNKTDSNELPNVTAEWDAERNDGEACGGTTGLTCNDGEPDGYFLARRPELLEKRLEALLRKITSTSNNAPAVSASQLRTGDFAYIANFSNDNRWGSVEAYALSASGSFATTPSWNGSVTLSSVTPSSRNVFTNVGTAGAAFTKSGLGGTSGAGYLALKTTAGTEADTDQLIDYLRGDATNEAAPGTSGKLWRYRAKDISAPISSSNPRYLMGTVINSTPWIQFPPGADLPDTTYRTFAAANASRTKLLWVGSNDGMLHAFKATGTGAGSPVASYVPSPMLGRLRALSLASNNTIVAGMDGNPYTADVKIGSNWKTYLFSSLGRGGKAVFALDVTDTASVGSNSFKWMFSSDDDADLGYVIQDVSQHPTSYQPTNVVRLENGKYAVLIPNGVNSSNGKAFLYALFVESSGSSWTVGTDYLKLATDDETGNGLVGVNWADTDANGMADTLYGTDLLGRLWRWKFVNPTPSVAMTTLPAALTTLLHEAKDGSNRLPTMTSPVVSFPEIGGVMVGFGTGKAIFTGDYPNSGLTQRFYSIYDKNLTSTVTSLSSLARRVAKRTSDGKAYIETASEVTGSVKSSTFNPALHKGWYLDFPPRTTSSTANAEILISSPVVSFGQLVFNTIRPAESTNNCFESPVTGEWMVDPTVGTPKVNNYGIVTVDGKKVLLAGVTLGGFGQKGNPGIIIKGPGGGSGSLYAKPEGGVGSGTLTNVFKVNRAQWREVPNMRTLD